MWVLIVAAIGAIMTSFMVTQPSYIIQTWPKTIGTGASASPSAIISIRYATQTRIYIPTSIRETGREAPTVTVTETATSSFTAVASSSAASLSKSSSSSYSTHRQYAEHTPLNGEQHLGWYLLAFVSLATIFMAMDEVFEARQHLGCVDVPAPTTAAASPSVQRRAPTPVFHGLSFLDEIESQLKAYSKASREASNMFFAKLTGQQSYIEECEETITELEDALDVKDTQLKSEQAARRLAARKQRETRDETIEQLKEDKVELQRQLDETVEDCNAKLEEYNDLCADGDQMYDDWQKEMEGGKEKQLEIDRLTEELEALKRSQPEAPESSSSGQPSSDSEPSDDGDETPSPAKPKADDSSPVSKPTTGARKAKNKKYKERRLERYGSMTIEQ